MNVPLRWLLGGLCQNKTSFPSRRSRAGFTLVELLVVIAIVGILASMLLPVLAKVRSQARRTDCSNRLRSLTLAQQLYADDNEGKIAKESTTRSVTQEIWAQVRSAAAIEVWYNALPRSLGELRASDYALSAAKERFYDRRRLFHCPEAVFPAAPANLPAVHFSLAMNSKLITFGKGTILFTDIRKPPATVMFTEGRLEPEPKVHPAQADLETGQPSVFANRFVTRHQGSGNLAFADGHVESRRGEEVVRDGWAIFPQTEIIWTAEPDWNPNLTP